MLFIWCTQFMILVMQLIKYAHTDPITCFRILVIPEAIFQVKAFKFGTVETLNRLTDLNPGFLL